MPQLTFPAGHAPRYNNFSIEGILDETLREGSKRCPFAIQTKDKVPLIAKILETGVKDVIFGSGPKDPSDLVGILEYFENEKALSGVKFSFIMLLNCHEPLMEQFKNFPASLMQYVTVSFGMITHDSETHLFERTTETLRSFGFESFRVSLLNNFGQGIDEETYEAITRQIDRSVAIDIPTVRINDSLGTIYPEAMAILAANLTSQYPAVRFSRHAHNDRGLALQNALASIYNGFNLIEGGFAGTGNRSGLPAIELLDRIFREKRIELASGPLDQDMVAEASSLAEQTFLVTPDLYRPISGIIVERENMGIANIPSFLGVNNTTSFFLNNVGLHDATFQKALREQGFHHHADDPAAISILRQRLASELEEIGSRKQIEYDNLKNSIYKYYNTDIYYASKVHLEINNIFG